jgi:integrase
MGLVGGHNPAENLPQVKPGRGVPKPVTKGEYQKLLAEAKNPTLRNWFILGGTAGLRAMEVANIKGSDLIEHEDGYSLRVQGKGGTDLIVPISPIVSDMIRSYSTLGRLWQVTPNKLSARAANEMRRILGPDAKHFHSLRHYFATTMLEKSGGDLIAVKELMRHTSVATTQIYTQLSQGRTRSLVNLLE